MATSCLSLGQFDRQLLLFIVPEVTPFCVCPPALHGSRRNEVYVLRERLELVSNPLDGTVEALDFVAVRQAGGHTAGHARWSDQMVWDLEDGRGWWRRRGRCVGRNAALTCLGTHGDAAGRCSASDRHPELQQVTTHFHQII